MVFDFEGHYKTAGIVAGILAPFVTAFIWAWKKLIGPRMAAAMAASIRESFADQNVVTALREALTKENVLMTEQIRSEFRVRVAQLDRVDAQVQDHDQTLDRLALVPKHMADIKDAMARQDRLLEKIVEVQADTKEDVGYLRGRVEDGTRTFRNAEGA